MRKNPQWRLCKHCGISIRKISTYSYFAIFWMTWRNNICDVNYSLSLFTFLQMINSMKLTWFFLCFIIKMLDKCIIYTNCMYNCFYHVSSVGKAVSLLTSRSDTAFPTAKTWYKQLYIHNVYIMCIYQWFVVNTFRSFLHSWLITGFVTRGSIWIFLYEYLLKRIKQCESFIFVMHAIR